MKRQADRHPLIGGQCLKPESQRGIRPIPSLFFGASMGAASPRENRAAHPGDIARAGRLAKNRNSTAAAPHPRPLSRKG